MERKELLDKVKRLERCERQERDRFLRERAAKEAVLQASKGCQIRLLNQIKYHISPFGKGPPINDVRTKGQLGRIESMPKSTE